MSEFNSHWVPHSSGLVPHLSKKLSKFYYFPINTLTNNQDILWGCPHGVMVKAIDCRIVVSEFELQLRYYVNLRTNTLGKGMNPQILLAMG